MEAVIWIVCSAGDMSRTKAARAALRKAGESKNWALQERLARPVRTPSGGQLQVVDARDVVALYRQAHRSAVALLVSRSIRFCTEPPENRAVRRDLTLKLARHCQYKTYCCNFPESKLELESFILGFDGWIKEINCDGETDARCLPFPIFKAKRDFDNLAEPSHRSIFDGAHRNAKAGGRLDNVGLSWETNPREYHGHEILTVAGRTLTKGFHWDVQNSNRKLQKIGSPTEIWEVMEYVNVFPDGKINGRFPYARKIYG